MASLRRIWFQRKAASSLGSIAVAPFFMALGGLGAALPPLMARMVAAQDRGGADRLLRQAWTCGVVLAVAVAATFMFAVRWLPANGQPAVVRETAAQFSSILIW